MLISSTNILKNKKRVSGAVSIEFALLFIIFFVIFYAIVAYAIFFLLQTSFNHAAAEGARSAISVDPQSFPSTSAYLENGVVPQVRETVGQSLSWMPMRLQNIVLGENNSNVDVMVTVNILTVTVSYNNYTSNPLIPLLFIPGIGSVFSPVQNIQGTASVRLS